MSIFYQEIKKETTYRYHHLHHDHLGGVLVGSSHPGGATSDVLADGWSGASDHCHAGSESAEGSRVDDDGVVALGRAWMS